LPASFESGVRDSVDVTVELLARLNGLCGEEKQKYETDKAQVHGERDYIRLRSYGVFLK
jgi:hypothetical protein